MKNFRGLALYYGAVTLAVAVAGCSGGGGASAPAPLSPGATPSPTATPSPAPTSTSAAKQSATLLLSFPHGPGSPRNFVSPNSSSVTINVNSVNGLPPPSWVPSQTNAVLAFTGPNQNCTVSNGLATCAVSIPAPPGNVNYTVFTFDVVTPGGQPVLLDENTETIAITQGKANSVSLTLKGVVKSALVSLPTPILGGFASNESMTLTAFDASGALITGTEPFLSPFKLTLGTVYGPSDPRYPLQALLSLPGLSPSKAIQVASPVDNVTLNYGGLALGQFNIVASGPGGAGQVQGTSSIVPGLSPIVLPGAFVDDAAHGGQPSDPNYNQNTIIVPLGGPAVSITPSELGFTNGVYGTYCKGSDSSQCFGLEPDIIVYTGCNAPTNPVATFNPAPGQIAKSYNYTITPGLAAGLCLDQFIDGKGGQHSTPPTGNPLVNGELWVKVQ